MDVVIIALLRTKDEVTFRAHCSIDVQREKESWAVKMCVEAITTTQRIHYNIIITERKSVRKSVTRVIYQSQFIFYDKS